MNSLNCAIQLFNIGTSFVSNLSCFMQGFDISFCRISGSSSVGIGAFISNRYS